MDEDIKKDIKRLAKNTELMIARSLLRWKYKKEDKPLPGDRQLDQNTRNLVDKAHEILARRGNRVLSELKKESRHPKKK